MKSIILIRLVALQAILARLDLVMVANPAVKDLDVEGKRESDGGPESDGGNLTFDDHMFGSDLQCGKDGWLDYCKERLSYPPVAIFGFSEPTEEPRSVTITSSNTGTIQKVAVPLDHTVTSC